MGQSNAFDPGPPTEERALRKAGSPELNPYAPPDANDTAQVAQRDEDYGAYRSLRNLTRLLTILLPTCGALEIFELWLTSSPNPGIASNDSALAGADPSVYAEGAMDAPATSPLLDGLTVLIMVAYVTTVVVFCVFLYRSNVNARALSGRPMRYTPGAMIWWYFIPFANLFKPYRALAEVWALSKPRGPLSGSRAPLGLWWALWLISGTLEWALFRATTSPGANTATELGWISTAVSVLLCATTLSVVRALCVRQTALADREA